jgi:hypothetical protein
VLTELGHPGSLARPYGDLVPVAVRTAQQRGRSLLRVGERISLQARLQPQHGLRVQL